MCADAAATLQHAASVCDGQSSCVLVAAPLNSVELSDNICSGFGGCDFLCPNSTAACEGSAAEGLVQYRCAVRALRISAWV